MLENINHIIGCRGLDSAEPVLVDFNGCEIYAGDTYYNICDDIVCIDCLEAWADKKCAKEEDDCYFLFAETYDAFHDYYEKVGYCLFGEFVAIDDLEKWAEDCKEKAVEE